MKKLLYLLIPGLLYLGSCSKDDPIIDDPGGDDNPEQPENPTPPPVEKGSTIAFGYCGDYYNAVGGSDLIGNVLEAAIEIPATQAQQWVGNSLSGMRIGYGQSSSMEVLVYVTKDLAGEPVYSQKVKLTTKEGWNTVEFDEPYVIDGSAFFIGYQSLIETAQDFPLGIDYQVPENSYSDWVALNNEWEHIGEYWGSVCIKALVSGDNLPQSDVALLDMYVPPFATLDSPVTITAQICNNGAATIKSVKVNVLEGDAVTSSQNVTLDESVAPGDYAWVDIEDVKLTQTGVNLPVVVQVAEVNGITNESVTSGALVGFISTAEKGFERNVVVEEFTGTWCGFCPRGIVGMKYMEENYAKDGFIGIAVHYNDDMQSSSYVEVANIFSGGSYPSAVIDRFYYFDPSAETLELYYQYETQYPTYAGLDVTATYDQSSGKIKVKGEAEFSLDVPDANYVLAFALKENNVGPYSQTNYFNTNQYGELEGWLGAGNKVSTMYNEVGREIVSPFGITNSLPSNITSGNVYSYEAELNANGYDISQCGVVAMIIDVDEYSIVNGAQLTLGSSEIHNLGKRVFSATKTRSLVKSPEDAKTIKEQKSLKAVKEVPANSRFKMLDIR